MVDRRNRYLAMAEDGAVYMGLDTVTLRAVTPDEAVERLTRSALCLTYVTLGVFSPARLASPLSRMAD